MAKWNRVYNLTAIRDADGVLAHHLLDSLSTVSRIAGLARHAQPDAPRVLDVGSDGDLSSVLLAIAFPNVSITMVGIIQKKTTFLTQRRAEFGLANIQSHWGHVKKPAGTTGYDAITSRTFVELVDSVNLARRLLAPGSRMVVMRGARPDVEIKHLPVGWTIGAIEHLTVPGLPARCHLVILTPSA